MYSGFSALDCKQKPYEIVALTGTYDVLTSDLEAKNADQAMEQKLYDIVTHLADF